MSEVKNIHREALIDKLSTYKGTIKELFKENNIPEKQFYYHRRKLADKNKVIFHEISLKSEHNSTVKNNNITDIRIEVGKATIYITANEIAALNAFVGDLSCNV